MNVVARSPTLRVLRVALLGATLALSCASDKERQLAASGGSGGAGRPGQTSGGTTAGGVTAGGTAAGGATAGASPTGG
ncbi:MAG TPA: kumamolisin, partial [Polyangiaceae bacterium]|nr:kumamolisin [Polyangiaceae bacterium]